MADQCRWDAVNSWIEAHRDALPRTLGELSGLPMAYRGAIVRALPPADREAIWREHFAAFLGPASPLSSAQQAFVREAMAELPSLMAEDLVSAQERARELERRMRPLFSRQEAARIFATLGPAELPGGLPAPGM